MKVDLRKDTIQNGRITQPTSRMAELCLKDENKNWLKFAHNLTEEQWNDKETLKKKYGPVFLTLTIPHIRQEINEFLTSKYQAWSDKKIANKETWTKHR